MPALRRIAYQFHTEPCFGAVPFIAVKQKPRIAADLPQLGKLRKHLYLRSRKFLIRLFGEHSYQTLHMGVIQAALLALHHGHHGLFDLIRKVGEHILFQPAQHKRPDHFMEAHRGFLILPGYDWRFHLLPETAVGKQEARHQVIKNAPQLTEPVFHRRSRQRKPEACGDLLHSPGRLGGMVLDKLRLVDYLAGEIHAGININIPAQQLIGGDYHTFFLPHRLLQKLLSLSGPACRRINRKHRGKAFHFAFPVEDQGSRTHDQPGPSRISPALLPLR